MIILQPKIFDLVKDSNAFYVLMASITKRASNLDKSCFPSIKTMANDTGFSENTVVKALKYLKEIGIIKVEARFTENGRQTSNWYVINTDLIMVAGALKTEIESSKVDKDTPPKFAPTPPQNLSTNYKYKLTNTTNSENDFLNFELDDQRKQILETKGFDMELYELELLNWRDYIAKQEAKPTNLTSSFTNWCLNSIKNHTKLKNDLDKTKSKEQIYKENSEATHYVDKYQYDNETIDEFEARVKELEAITGSKYRLHYRGDKNPELFKFKANLLKNKTPDYV